MPQDAVDVPRTLPSFGEGLTAVVVGATGGIGGALADVLESSPSVDRVYRLARRPPPAGAAGAWLPLDLESEASIADAAEVMAAEASQVHLAIVASGLLHAGPALQPEKTWRALEGPSLERAFRVNSIGPALVAKHLLPLLARDRKTAFAALSARVSSIEDNELGGWHAYRASKAALNMLIRNLAIELSRRNPTALCVGLHPGTVDTDLSKPFQRGVPDGKLFSPAHAAQRLLTVLDGLQAADSGRLFAWDGQRVPF